MNWKTALVRILLSFVAGFFLGLERERRQQPAGLRTHVIICISSTLIMLVSIYMGKVLDGGDSSRVAAQIVSGIGFLGGGAILHHGLNIRGLTTAATIWIAAGIGMAIGCGFYSAAFITLFVAIESLFVLAKIESHYFPAERIKHLYLIFENDNLDFEALTREITKTGILVSNMDVSKTMDVKRIRLVFQVRVPDKVNVLELAKRLGAYGKLQKIKLVD